MVGVPPFPEGPNDKDEFPWDDPLWIRVESIMALIPWNNQTNKLAHNEVLELINAEYYKIFTAGGLAAYTYDDDVRLAMRKRLNGSSNIGVTKHNWLNLVDVICSEFEEASDKGWDYVIREDLLYQMNKTMMGVPNVTHKVAVYRLIRVYWIGFMFLSLAAFYTP
jgi:hypothetical protein